MALVLDGKTFADDEMVIALGVTVKGHKVILGFVQTATENKVACAAFLRELVARGAAPPGRTAGSPRRQQAAAAGGAGGLGGGRADPALSVAQA